MRLYICKRLSTVLLLTFLGIQLLGQTKYTVSGTISDAEDGEDLIGVNVYIPSLNIGTATNVYGFYSITLPAGDYEIELSCLAYETKKINLSLTNNIRKNIALNPQSKVLQEITVTGELANANVSRSEMSMEKLTAREIKVLPAMMGEVDIIKAIQLLPGVQSVSEGSSSFSVRGGGHDQNLILLDEATVYSASHLMGFFSVFNNDAVKDLKLYKGDLPAVYGGRLSSLMDVRTKDGNSQKLEGTGGIGTISSRLTLEGPILRDKMTFIVSGRRTYADIFLPLAKEQHVKDSKLYFYDLNAKFNYKINENNRLFLAGYFGRDLFASDDLAEMNFGNKTLTVRWNHIFSPKVFSNFTLIGSHYDYAMATDINESVAQDWKSTLRDMGFKGDLSYHPNPQNNIKFGYALTHHRIARGTGGGIGENSIIKNFDLPKEYALEHALYVSNETNLFQKLSLKYGLRYSVFQNMGNDNFSFHYVDYVLTDSTYREKGKTYNTQMRLEPRVGINYMFNDKHSIKTSYSRSAQYIQLASNSASGSPVDIWFYASENVKPQISDQFAVGYFRNFSDNMFESSVELYYKNLKNVVDFKERASLFGGIYIDEQLRFGKGYAYGAEFLLRKNKGSLTGWISYTYSRSFRKIDLVNNNEWYRSPYDRPHSISVVVNYELQPKWMFSASWVYATGIPVTYPLGRYQIEGIYVPIYSKPNEYRYPDYHRLDLSATYKLSKPSKRFQHELNFSLYNAYGRKNPWTVYFKQNEENPDIMEGEMMYLFSFVPSITWNFNF